MDGMIVGGWIILSSIILFFLMMVDKQKAKKQEYRISEKTLWIWALIGGAIGGTLGMNTFRHKTKHTAFKFGFPFLAICHIVLFIYLVQLKGWMM